MSTSKSLELPTHAKWPESTTKRVQNRCLLKKRHKKTTHTKKNLPSHPKIHAFPPRNTHTSTQKHASPSTPKNTRLSTQKNPPFHPKKYTHSHLKRQKNRHSSKKTHPLTQKKHTRRRSTTGHNKKRIKKKLTGAAQPTPVSIQTDFPSEMSQKAARQLRVKPPKSWSLHGLFPFLSHIPHTSNAKSRSNPKHCFSFIVPVGTTPTGRKRREEKDGVVERDLTFPSNTVNMFENALIM